MNKKEKAKFPETDNPKVSPRVKGVRKFRQSNPRIDYYPMPNAIAAIEWLRERNPKVTMRELIDALVIEGQKSFSGNK